MTTSPMPPTNKEELRKKLTDLFFRAAGGITDMATVEVNEAMQLTEAYNRHLLTEAFAAVRPGDHKERPHKFFSGGYESELAAYVDGHNQALSALDANIQAYLGREEK